MQAPYVLKILRGENIPLNEVMRMSTEEILMQDPNLDSITKWVIGPLKNAIAYEIEENGYIEACEFHWLMDNARNKIVKEYGSGYVTDPKCKWTMSFEKAEVFFNPEVTIFACSTCNDRVDIEFPSGNVTQLRTYEGLV